MTLCSKANEELSLTNVLCMIYTRAIGTETAFECELDDFMWRRDIYCMRPKTTQDNSRRSTCAQDARKMRISVVVWLRNELVSFLVVAVREGSVAEQRSCTREPLTHKGYIYGSAPKFLHAILGPHSLRKLP